MFAKDMTACSGKLPKVNDISIMGRAAEERQAVETRDGGQLRVLRLRKVEKSTRSSQGVGS
jgi:hypothetical protein